MIIRPDQLTSMNDAMQRRYHGELRKLLRGRFPQLVTHLDDRTLIEHISVSTKWANAYGIRTGRGILAYVGLSLAAGPAFHTDENISAYLRFPGDSPDKKIHRLFMRVAERLLSIAAKRASLQKQPGSEA